MAESPTKIRNGKYGYEFDPYELAGLDRGAKLPSDVLEDIADFVQTKMLETIGGAKSPVNNKPYTGLSKDYRKFKRDFGPAKPNLELQGDMLDALQARIVSSRNSVVLEFESGTQSKKARNHDIGDTLPKRQIFPHAGESLRPGIRQGVRSIINDYLREQDDG